jgi:hypothetical protein
MAAASPASEIMGLPATPSPLEMAKPAPVTAILRLVTALADVLAIIPVPASSNEPAAPLSVIL